MREQEVLDYKLVKAESSESLNAQIHILVQGEGLWEPQGSAIIIAGVSDEGKQITMFYQTMFRYNPI